MALLNTLKIWWGSSRVPSVEQRHETLDSFYHKEESIPISAITNLQNVLNAKADAAGVTNNVVFIGPGVNTYTVPANTLISHITFLSFSGTLTINIKRADNQEYVDDIDITANDIIDCKRYFSTETLLTFNGINEETIIRITKG